MESRNKQRKRGKLKKNGNNCWMEKVGRFLKKLTTDYVIIKQPHLQVYIQENKIENLRGITSAVLCFSSVQSWPKLCNPVDCSTPGFPVHHQLPPKVYSNSCPLSWWCHPTISSSVVPFSFCLQSFPPSGSFQMSQLFASGGQSIGVSASASVLPMSVQDRFPLGWTGWISLKSKGLSRVFSNTTVQKHQFFSTQLSLQSNSHIHTWLLEKP